MIRTSDIKHFIELLKNKDKTYNAVVVIDEPQQQHQQQYQQQRHQHQQLTGGERSILLQIIGLTKIKAIIKYMNSANGSKLDISNVTYANDLINMDNMNNIIIAIAEFFYNQQLMLKQQDKN